MYQLDRSQYRVIVVGAGHAGCEAALACARIGLPVLLLTMNLDNVALMPCNPSIGGPGKAHLVREIDALGGEMGRNTDATSLQFRMLNTRKGPAVQALRAQTDRRLYQRRMKKVLESTQGLYLKEGIVEDLLLDKQRVCGVLLKDGTRVLCEAVVLATGTYLRSEVFLGDIHYPSGPQGQHAANTLADRLERWLPLKRFKTGTPPRVNLRSVDFAKMVVQPGDRQPFGFSFESPLSDMMEQVPCYLTYTTTQTHAIIRANLHKAAMYSGAITGRGPRYCPSIESKVVQFPDRRGHQVFVEPEGWETHEGYLSGLSTSLPVDIQLALLRTIPGLENVEVMRAGYAIEYDCIDPQELQTTLETKAIRGLFTAGQLNGTSGYEEAAAQGIVAGINAAAYCKNTEPLILRRSQGYIGVLIDDLVIKGTSEPYRMMTSRAEYRLLLRQSNADERLTPIGYRLGLIDESRFQACERKWKRIHQVVSDLKSKTASRDENVRALLQRLGSADIKQGMSLADLLRRPEVRYEDLRSSLIEPLTQVEQAEVEMTIKYEGYIRKQQQMTERFLKMEKRRLPDLDYHAIKGLSSEAKEKLAQVRPRSLGEASRISGVSPADLSVLLVHLEQRQRGEEGGMR